MLTTGFLHPGMTLTFQLREHKQRSGPSSSSQGQMETFGAPMGNVATFPEHPGSRD